MNTPAPSDGHTGALHAQGRSTGHQARGATVSDLLDRAAELFADRVAIVDGDHRFTYSTIREGALAVARGLPTLGVKPGDRVAIWMPNRVEWVIAFFGAVRAGAVVVPLNTGLVGAEAEYQITQSGAVVVVAASSYRARNLAAEAMSIVAATGSRVTVISVGESHVSGTVAWKSVANYGESDLGYTPSRDDPIVMLYTSGTTGLPKGAVHTHRFLDSLLSAADRMELNADDCIVLYLPLFHVYALMAGLLLMTAVGAKLVLMTQFDSTKSLALIEAESATIIYGVPTTYIDQLNDPAIDSYDVSSIRLSITPFSRDLSERVAARFGYCVNCFGMTETASIAFLPRLNDPPEIAIGTVGRPLEGLDMRIVNPEDGSPVEAGAAGLLQLRGPQVMSEYHYKPEETAKAFDDDGWFRTGDMAQVDAAGNLTFIGRRSDHFKVGGEYVDPAEVEAALQSHPAVERAAVVGVPDDRLGHVTYAWVKLRRTASRDYPETPAEALIEHTRSRVAFFKVPRAVYVVEEFPVTPSGKIQKFKLTDSLKDADR